MLSASDDCTVKLWCLDDQFAGMRCLVVPSPPFQPSTHTSF
jgi:hypothetical protein